MLYTDHVVITCKTEHTHHVLPDDLIVPIADSPEVPRSVLHFTVAFCIQYSIYQYVPGIQERVFRVKVVNALSQFAYCSERINSLPEHVTGIKIHPDNLAAMFSQLEECFRVVNDKAGMQL